MYKEIVNQLIEKFRRVVKEREVEKEDSVLGLTWPRLPVLKFSQQLRALDTIFL